MKIYDESHYCQECGEEISTQEDMFFNGYCENCYYGQASTEEDDELSPEDAASLLAQPTMGPYTFEELTQLLTQPQDVLP